MFYLNSNGRTGSSTSTASEPADILAAATKTKKETWVEKFHLGDILSVMLDFAPICPRGNEGVRQTITTITGVECPEMRLGDLGEINRLKFHAKAKIRAQMKLPFPELKKDLEETRRIIDGHKTSFFCRNQMISSWITKQVRLYGEFHELNV